MRPPRALGIKVAWFIMKWQLVFECMVAEQLSWCLEEGTNHLNTAAQVPTIAHAPEALGSCASNQRQQDGFHLVIGVVTQQHMGKFCSVATVSKRVVASARAAAGLTGGSGLVGGGECHGLRTTFALTLVLFLLRHAVVLHRDDMQCPRGACTDRWANSSKAKNRPARDRDQPPPICSPHRRMRAKIPQQGDSTRFIIRFGQG